MKGKRVFFQTGSDEHGQKIANRAAALGVAPIEICDKYAGEKLAATYAIILSYYQRGFGMWEGRDRFYVLCTNTTSLGNVGCVYFQCACLHASRRCFVL